jgi:hypothetical protein
VAAVALQHEVVTRRASIIHGRVVGQVRGTRHANSEAKVAQGGIADHRATLANLNPDDSVVAGVVAGYDPSGDYPNPDPDSAVNSNDRIALHDSRGDYPISKAVENAQSLNDRAVSRGEIDPEKEMGDRPVSDSDTPELA